MPNMKWAKQSRTKEAAIKAYAPKTAPRMANAPPRKKPSFRPRRPINKDIGAAQTSPAKVCTDAGSVANAVLGASIRPASPPRMIRIGMAEPSTVLAVRSPKKFRF